LELSLNLSKIKVQIPFDVCEGMTYVFLYTLITHFLGYVIGIGVVGHIKCL